VISKGRLHATEPRNSRRERDGSISGSEPDDDDEELASTEGLAEKVNGSDSDEVETAVERRLRLAESYLDNIREEVDAAGFDAADIDRDLIAERLREDIVCSYSIRSPS